MTLVTWHLKIRNFKMLVKQCFWQNLKLTDAKPVYKKKDSNLVENYMPVSVLPSVSKMFDRIIQKQISLHIINFLSRFLCGYRKKASFSNCCFIIHWKEQDVSWPEKICRSSWTYQKLSNTKLNAYGFLSYISER